MLKVYKVLLFGTHSIISLTDCSAMNFPDGSYRVSVASSIHLPWAEIFPLLPTAALISSEELHRTTVKWIKFSKCYVLLEKILYCNTVINSGADEPVGWRYFVQL